jgi:hypothetical protein
MIATIVHAVLVGLPWAAAWRDNANGYGEAVTTRMDASVRRVLAIQMIIDQERWLSMNGNPLHTSHQASMREEALQCGIDWGPCGRTTPASDGDVWRRPAHGTKQSSRAWTRTMTMTMTMIRADRQGAGA